MKRFFSLLAVLAVLTMSQVAHANEFSWDAGGGTDKNWDTDTNWSNDTKPVTGLGNTITLGEGYETVLNISSLQVGRLILHKRVKITLQNDFETARINSYGLGIGTPDSEAPVIVLGNNTFTLNKQNASAPSLFFASVEGNGVANSTFDVQDVTYSFGRRLEIWGGVFSNLTFKAPASEIYCFADFDNVKLLLEERSIFITREKVENSEIIVNNGIYTSTGRILPGTTATKITLNGTARFTMSPSATCDGAIVESNDTSNTTILAGCEMKNTTVNLNGGEFNNYGTLKTTTITSQANTIARFYETSETEGNIITAEADSTIYARNAVNLNTYTMKDDSKFHTYLWRDRTDGKLKARLLNATNQATIGEVKIILDHDSIQEVKNQTELVPIFFAEAGLQVQTRSGETVDQAKARIIAQYNNNPDYFDFSAFNTELYSASIEFCTQGKSLLLSIQRIASYTDIADPGNKQVARALDGGDNLSCSNGFAKLLNAIDGTHSHEEYNEALRKLKPRQQTSARLLAHDSGLAALSQMSAYRTSRRMALKGIPYKLTINPTETGFASTDINPGTTLAQALPLTPGERKDREIGKDQMVSVFARATAGYTRVGNGSNRIGLRSSRVGAVFGIDMRLHENFLIGFTGSYDYSDVSFLSHLGGGRVNSYRFGPYAMMYHDDWFIEAELTLGLHNNKFRRRVAIDDDVFLPESQYNAIDFTASIGAGYDFHLGGFTITPRVNLQYQFYHADRFSEKNGSGANLNVSKYDTSALSSRLGVEFWKRFEVNEQYLSAVTPFFNVGWRHEWIAPTDLKSQFQGGGSAFNIDNDLFSRNAIYLGIGGTAELTEQLNLDVRYQADLGDRENRSQNIYLSLRYKF